MDVSGQDVSTFFDEWSSNVGTELIPRIIAAIVIIVIGLWVSRLLTNAVLKALRRANIDETLQKFFGQLIYYALVALVIVIALANLGIPTASIVAVLGASALAVGLALQDTLSNVASGVLIIFLRPYHVNDVVKLGDEFGAITNVRFFHTELRTPDNRIVLIPNSDVMDGNITNFSKMDWVRADMSFGIGYGDDLLKAKGILQEIVGADERITDDPEPTVAVQELGDSSVNLAVFAFTRLEDRVSVQQDITEKVKLRFDEEGISIPFPQRDIHLIGSQVPVNGSSPS